MRRSICGFAAIATVAGVMLAGAWLGAEEPKQPTAEDQAKMMEAWAKYASPGENHKLMEPIIGKWSAVTTAWMAPGAPPAQGSGTAENAWVLEGRFVQQMFQGEFMGQKYTGLGFTGYDVYRKEFIGSWMDTMGTMMMILSGTADASGKVINMSSEIDDVMSGKRIKVRSVVRIVDANRHIYEMYGPDPAGKEFKTMEIVYTRK